MSRRTITTSKTIQPHPRPSCRIESEKSLLDITKKGERILSTLSFHYEPQSNSAREKMFRKSSQLCRKLKYCRHISTDKGFVATATLISRTLKCIRRFTNTKKLSLICPNNTLEDRVCSYNTLKPLRWFNRLEAVQFNIFFNPAKRLLYTKFGSLIQAMRVKKLTIKEPLTLASDRLIRRFNMRARRVAMQLKSLALTDFTPMESQIEKYIPYRLTRRAVYLRELHLNLVGVSLENRSLNVLLVLVRGMRYLKRLNLDLSFNKISNLDGLLQISGAPINHVHLNFSYCPLEEGSITQLAQFVKKNQRLDSVELVLNSVEITQANIFELSDALGSLQNLSNVGISLSDSNCLDVRHLWRFFNQFLLGPKLTKANFNLSQALCMGLHPDIKATPLRSASLKHLTLNLNHNRIRSTEVSHVMGFFEFCVGIEQLRLSLDYCKLSGRAGEMIWKWVSTLKNLKGLDISMRYTDISETCVSELLKGVSRLGLQDFKIDLIETCESVSLAKELWRVVLGLKKVKSVKIMSTYVGMGVPTNYQEILKTRLPGCAYYEIC